MEIQEDSRNLIAFATQKGLWQFKRILIRISTTPAVYSRFIAIVMNPLISEVGQLYLKYIISYNNEVRSHVLQMKLVFNAHRSMQESSWRPKKMILFGSSIDYLGQPASEISQVLLLWRSSTCYSGL